MFNESYAPSKLTVLGKDTVLAQLNNCYMDYVGWPIKADLIQQSINSFCYHLEATGGLRVRFVPTHNDVGRYGYKVDTIDVVDESLFTIWLLRWTK